jgi:DDE superfamily endonuclease
MEDVLDVYCQPYDPAVPRICMDEMGKNLVKDKYPPEPAKPGQVAREDYTYEKEGRANLFIAYEPLAGKRCLKVTEHRTKKDWALFMQEVLEEQYPEASKVVVVIDNLNTQEHRNQRVGTVNWQFRTADARIKLKRLYPVQSPAAQKA